MEQRRIRIIIADDHALFRKGIMELLKDNLEFDIIDDVGDGEKLISSYFNLKPDIILADIAMPKLSGFQAFEKIKSIDPLVKALFLTMHTEEIYYFQIYTAGGKGLIDKNINIEELENAIYSIMEGRIYFGSHFNEEKLQSLVLKFRQNENNLTLNNVEISKRELEILQCIRDCVSSEEIATKLEISIRTVEKHRQNIIRKAGTKNYFELYRFAYEFTKDMVNEEHLRYLHDEKDHLADDFNNNPDKDITNL